MYDRRLKPSVVAPLLAAIAAVSMISPLAAQESGWLGFELLCSNCKYEQTDGLRVWFFAAPPVVKQVREDGPAARAGFLEGDTIIEIDGLEITSEQGGRAFGAMRAGRQVTFLVRRGAREVALSVTPGTHHEVYREWHDLALSGDSWDSLKVQVVAMSQEQMKLQAALRNAQSALNRTEAMQATAEQEQIATALRTRIDSIRREVRRAQVKLRLQADALARRTLWVAPSPQPDVAVVLPPPENRSLHVYRNAVAGARFEELDEDSPLVSYFPGVDGGLLIVKIVEGTPAYEAGLREGDVVFAVNGEQVSTVAGLRRALRAQRESEIGYVRKGEKRYCKISSK